MATLTRNLFWGQGERDHLLEVVSGHWPTDVEGAVVIVGPDKRAPGGHWFAEHGLLCRIELDLDGDGRVGVRHRRIATPLSKLRRALPFLFGRLAFLEISPFGVSNLANTNVQPLDGRLFVGYDAGRPIEVDPETLEYLTPVGANDEWLQGVPGLLEPLVAVAAHPAPDHDEHALWFVNYSQMALPGEEHETWLAHWGLDGPVRRWRLTGMGPFDSIHDVKATRNHVVICDLPFVVEPESMRGAPRTQRSQEHATLWIVDKADLAEAPPGSVVPVRTVRLPMPSGHFTVDEDDDDGVLRVVLQHIPLGDLMISLDRETRDHRNDELVDPAYEGLAALAVQPTAVGRYRIDAATGEVLEGDVAWDAERLWGGVLATGDVHRAGARARQRRLFYSGVGFDPDLIPQAWWSLYGDATDGLVAPAELPESAIPGALGSFDLESMKVAEVWSFPDGSFASPPTFVPRAGSDEPDDGYVVVLVHRDGPKQVQVFDAADLERGPLAVATAPDFNPSLPLHSCWVAPRAGGRGSSYRVPLGRDIRGALLGYPGVVRSIVSFGRRAAAHARTQRSG